MRSFKLACLLLLLLAGFPSPVLAAEYEPDLICYAQDENGNDVCAPHEYTQVCRSHPNTHLATVPVYARPNGMARGDLPTGSKTVCVDNAPASSLGPMKAYYTRRGATCHVPNTVPSSDITNACESTNRTPNTSSYRPRVSWFCSSPGHRPLYGPQGYKCIANTPQTCPGIPPHRLEPVVGYPQAYECVPVSADPRCGPGKVSVPITANRCCDPSGGSYVVITGYNCINDDTPQACTSTEVLTTIFATTPERKACIQQWPWTEATFPCDRTTPAGLVCLSKLCAGGETLINNGESPAKYGCGYAESCPNRGVVQVVASRPGYTVSKCIYYDTVSCKDGQVAQVVDPHESPLRYTCEVASPPDCPDDYQLNVSFTPPDYSTPVYNCQPRASMPPTITCPAGQSAVLDTSVPMPYYVCSPPPAMEDCGVGYHRELSGTGTPICVINSRSTPANCGPGSSPLMINPAPISQYVCQNNPPSHCPDGYRAIPYPDPSVPNSVLYNCEKLPTGNMPNCLPAQQVEVVTMGPPPVYNCIDLPPPPVCPRGTYVYIKSASPLEYGCGEGGN